MTRIAEISRKTKETEVKLRLNIDGSGKSKIDTPIKFLNHMLENFSRHSRFDLELKADGDTEVEDHHLVEDIGICLGMAIDNALGNKIGISRIGSAIVPMDDSLATVAVDLSGRGYARIDIRFSEFKDSRIGDLKKENVPHFLETLAINGRFNLHVRVEGENDHHRVEAIFKALGKALYDATRIIGNELPSTKGVL
ncbi:MAG: imidazoleglycerol-phosphate dehydratase HisB [Candidatus Altiarchaeales archaeon]|nr:MAG: imidazoleglycerol-phosphate dehydratase HisB [Candidatus Altiarchaeales archaeon]RLI95222.1 MAG: imidazoleglycerol-phosphate dehydratase HisB [Candidatus Altiarchaeales archaeon]RLI95256.1 MAG: imidazoleglycerol-phosphate dehydratase HisB [Candidatus Altiarchaeales archaeon]HDO82644.1 imidazoleglycerol-phosphate dehydratase HisB [Candidatus Altiarchaeales archaeon]HEX55293.1 imidazoleglycerol-phosphate dehydratase HisB [Candidatus Altiarchaeales archaeon]